MKPEEIKEAVEFSNFAQYFKMMVWERMRGSFLSEDAMDEIAKLLFDYLKK